MNNSMLAGNESELKESHLFGRGYEKASVIDLGSNSVKMVNYFVDSFNSYKPYHQESVNVRLAEGMVDGKIEHSRIEKTIDTLKLFKNIVDFEQIDYVVAVATSAVRDAKNQKYLVERIKKDVGFDFMVLSEHEEALYSSLGAACSLNLPSAVFFDIGGGSLEIVSYANFKVRKVVSLPLGHLSLTRKFFSKSETSENPLVKIKQHVKDLLPTREFLDVSDLGNDVVLVGVGGILRALAKRYQEITHYPLKKIHNFEFSFDALNSVIVDQSHSSPDDIAKTDLLNGKSLALETGYIVISELMKKLHFSSLVVSAQGLREGSLLMSLKHPKAFFQHEAGISDVEELSESSHGHVLLSPHVRELAHLLFSVGLISKKEHAYLFQSILQIGRLSSFRDVENVLHAMLDDDSFLSHREQLIVALSLIYSKKKKKAETLIARFGQILQQPDKKTIKRISTVVSLCDIFHKTGAFAKPTFSETGLLHIDICATNSSFPEILLNQACKKMENALDVSVDVSIGYGQESNT